MMHEQSLVTLANIAVAFAAFSGLVMTLRGRGADSWTSIELRVLWFLIGDSFLVLFFALFPLPLSLAGWSPDTIWGVSSALLGSWFLLGFFLSLRGEYRDRAMQRRNANRFMAHLLPVLNVLAMVMGVALWLSVGNLLIARGQAMFVTGLIVLLGFAAAEFMYFIGLMAPQKQEE